MINHVWSVLCNTASFDVQTGLVSLLNIIEIANLTGEPNDQKPGVINAEIVSLWHRSPDEKPTSGQARFSYISPDGKGAEPITLPIQDDQSPFHHTRLTLPMFPAPQLGLYTFVVELQYQHETTWEKVATLPMIVKYQPEL
jgi:hypothetical protein